MDHNASWSTLSNPAMWMNCVKKVPMEYVAVYVFLQLKSKPGLQHMQESQIFHQLLQRKEGLIHLDPTDGTKGTFDDSGSCLIVT